MKKMSNTNEELLQEFITTRGLSKSTYYSFRNALRHYCNFQEKNIARIVGRSRGRRRTKNQMEKKNS